MLKLLPSFLLLALAGPAATYAQQPTVRLLARFTNDAPATTDASAARQQLFDQLNRRFATVGVEPLVPARAENLNTAAPAVYVIKLPASADADQALAAYRQSGLFRYVELDAVGHGGGGKGIAPNDFLYPRQWAFHNTGSFNLAPAKAGADIKMEDAWAITPGDASVTVAFIDSGCKPDHPELDGRFWRNSREIAGNNLDDDGNGYVDDVHGWNFADDNNNMTDDSGHGTNITGIVGANGNNSLAYAGVNWGCKLLVCKALNVQNSGQYSWFARAIYYSIANGARVINMAVGGTAFSQTLQDAVDYATQRGVVITASMMNTNNSTAFYPAALNGVVAVGSTSPDDTRTVGFPWDPLSGSNFGRHISVVAPGNYIYGLDYRSNTDYSTYWSGTSQATAHVTGIVSLLLTQRPQLTPAQVKTILQSSANDQVGNAAEDTPGWDQYYGYGRVNAARALATVVVTGTRRAQTPLALEVYPNPARQQLTLRTTDSRLLNSEVHIFDSVGHLVHRQRLTSLSVQMSLRLAPGVYRLTLAGTGSSQPLLIQ